MTTPPISTLRFDHLHPPRPRIPRALIAGATVAVLCTAGAAAAQSPPATEAAEARPWASSSGLTGLGLRPGQRLRAWFELGVHSQDDATAFLPVVGLGYRITESAELDAVLPMVNVSGDEDSAFVVGNPTFGIHYLGRFDAARVRIGFSLAAPVATVDSEPETQQDAEDALRRFVALL